ncbi:hypothetical protein [Microbacterium sp.]|uniref:hypothetical protein n=1 Tax=Microbacterium sp. TaxID=51671 RepID=UPI002BC1B5F0|nr:hypothetical protein [Microbacterium sp.]HWK76623.1 hypothetical protein [Microbacterium sp.]
MPDADSSAELRMLRAKAYGPGGDLSADELARLQELEGRLRPSAATSPPPLNDPHEDDSPEDDPQEDLFGSLSEERSSETTLRQAQEPRAEHAERAEASTQAPAAARRRWPVLAASIAGILAIGFGIGWAIWGWDARSFALTAAHGDQRAELEKQYDPGTVVAMAEQHGAVVWRAERSNGAETCVIITLSDRTSSGCTTYEELEKNGWWPSTSITVPDGQENAGRSLSAAVLRTVDGELVPYIQLQSTDDWDWESQYSEAELAQLRQIEAAGYRPENLSIIGSDGDTNIWYDWAGQGLCIIAIIDDQVMDDCAEDVGADVALSTTVDGVPTDYILSQTEMRGPQFTVVRHPAPTTVDSETGDVIDPSGDDPMFDDLFSDDPEIDDKTGE